VIVELSGRTLRRFNAWSKGETRPRVLADNAFQQPLVQTSSARLHGKWCVVRR
jgi:hypothetical protein